MPMLTTTTANNVLHIALDDGKANVLGTKMLRALAKALADGKDADAALVTGRDKIFSGGLDLAEVTTLSKADLTTFLELFHATFRALFAFDRPLVTAARGGAVAGGAILLCTGDLRLSSRDKGLIGVNEARLGVPFPVSAFEIMKSALGPNEGARAMVIGDLMGKDDALRRGFVHELCEPEALATLAAERAQDAAKTSRKATAAIKGALRKGALERIDAERDGSISAFADAWSGPESQARLAAIMAEMKKR
jgi:enoyl-CoA hydratase